MGEVYFYHLTRSPLEVTLPDLLEKSRARGWNVVIKGNSSDRLKWLDDRLWSAGGADFLPHGLAGGPQDGDQPVLLTLTDDIPNGAKILMAIDGAEISPETPARYQRVCVLFDGNDAASLDIARGQWKTLTDAGCAARYWAQEDSGWQQKAEKNIAG